VTAATAAALRACAAGYYPAEAGTELLIRHDCFLHRRDFAGFVHACSRSLKMRMKASSVVSMCGCE
jgi:hypothetical protein